MIKRGKRYSILSAVGLCVRCSAGVSVAVMLLYLFQGLTPALLTLATGAFIDAAIGLLRSGEYADVGRALTAVSLLVSFDWISNQLLDLLVGRLRIDVRERFGTEMVEKVADLRYRYVENPESWDLITKISTDTDESILNAFQALLAFMESAGFISGDVSICASSGSGCDGLCGAFGNAVFGRGASQLCRNQRDPGAKAAV